MTIPLPNLDDRTFNDLMQEMRALIPRYADAPGLEWTDHNLSDPGIMLLEMFAWVTEALIYQLNRIPEESELRFYELLGASEADEDPRKTALDNLNTRWRAITATDFEELAMSVENGPVRARCYADRDLKDVDDPGLPRPGHVSVVIIPDPDRDPTVESEDSEALCDSVKELLEERRLIACNLHVVDPVYTEVRVLADVIYQPGVRASDVKKAIIDQLARFFDPVRGGADGEGWEFGRNVYASEVYEQIEGVDGVEHVEMLQLQSGVTSSGQAGLATIELPERHLVKYIFEPTDIKVR